MKRVLKLLVSSALLIGAFMMLDGPALRESLHKVKITDILIATSLCVVVYCVTGLRWHRMIQPIQPRPWTGHLAVYFVATFVNMFTPANIGGDAYRFFNLSRGTKPGTVLGLLVSERILGLLSYLFIFLVSLAGVWLFYPPLSQHGRVFFSYAGLSVSAALVVLLLLPRLAARFASSWLPSEGRLQTILRACLTAINASRGAEFAILLGQSLLAVTLWILAVGVIARGLGMQPGWAALGVTAVMAELIRLVPVTVQGIGLREAAYAFLFSMLGQLPEHGFVLGTVCYIVLNCAALLVGAAGFLLMHIVAERPENQS